MTHPRRGPFDPRHIYRPRSPSSRHHRPQACASQSHWKGNCVPNDLPDHISGRSGDQSPHGPAVQPRHHLDEQDSATTNLWTWSAPSCPFLCPCPSGCPWERNHGLRPYLEATSCPHIDVLAFVRAVIVVVLVLVGPWLPQHHLLASTHSHRKTTNHHHPPGRSRPRRYSHCVSGIPCSDAAHCQRQAQTGRPERMQTWM